VRQVVPRVLNDGDHVIGGRVVHAGRRRRGEDELRSTTSVILRLTDLLEKNKLSRDALTMNEKIAVALVLDRPGWLREDGLTMLSASFAAPDPDVPISRIRFFTGELRSQRCSDG
jgi:hypothetical protein